MSFEPTEQEISRYTLRHYGFDAIAIKKQLQQQTEELLSLPPEEAKKVALARLRAAGLVDEFGNLAPPYNEVFSSDS